MSAPIYLYGSNESTYCVVEAPRRHLLWYRTKDGDRASVEPKLYGLPCPWLIYIIDYSRDFCCISVSKMYATPTRPVPKTVLFCLPFPNVDPLGRACPGTTYVRDTFRNRDDSAEIAQIALTNWWDAVANDDVGAGNPYFFGGHTMARPVYSPVYRDLHDVYAVWERLSVSDVLSHRSWTKATPRFSLKELANNYNLTLLPEPQLISGENEPELQFASGTLRQTFQQRWKKIFSRA